MLLRGDAGSLRRVPAQQGRRGSNEAARPRAGRASAAHGVVVRSTFPRHAAERAPRSLAQLSRTLTRPRRPRPRRYNLGPERGTAAVTRALGPNSSDQSSASSGSAAPGSARERKTYPDQVPVVQAPETRYQDSFADLAFMHLCRQAFGRVAGWQSPRPWAENYLGMVEVSHALMRGRSAQEQQRAVLQGFPAVAPWFRALFPYSDWGAEANARITPAFFSWLVGPCSIEEAQIVSPKGEAKVLKSAVKIEKCRYLETSGCLGMCVNLCKVPTQYFFNNELGMPLTMEPNFEDMSCRMIFGQAPPPLDSDPALSQPCFASCPTATANAPACPKLT